MVVLLIPWYGKRILSRKVHWHISLKVPEDPKPPRAGEVENGDIYRYIQVHTGTQIVSCQKKVLVLTRNH